MRADIGIEENSGMQAISKAGKMLFPCEDTPNLSFTGSQRMTGPSRSVVEPPELPRMENKTYVSFLISDGDNTDYVCHWMRQRWAEPDRGKIPLGWSLPPALSEAAPAMLDYYYRTATPNDTFFAGSSGAAIMYPDFYPASRLPTFLNRTRQLMDLSGLRSVWLINSYTALETEYSDKALSTYVDYLNPTGIFLDYGDVPVSRPYWIQNGNVHGGVPVIRSVHMWGSTDNVVAKILLDAERHPAGPYFIFVTVHVWTMGLADVMDVVRQLNASAQGPHIGFVAPATLLKYIQQDAVRKASSSFGELKGDGFASLLAGSELAALDSRLAEAKRAQTTGDFGRSASEASRVDARVGDILSGRDTALFAIAVVIVMAALIAILYLLGRRTGMGRPHMPAGMPALALALAATFVFFQSMFGVLFSYMWDWLAFAAIIPAALVAVWATSIKKFEMVAPSARIAWAAAILSVGAMAQFITVWAAAVAAFGYVWLQKELSGRLGHGERVLAIVLPFTVSCAILNIISPRPLVTGLSVLWVVFFAGWELARPAASEATSPEEAKVLLRDNFPVWMPAIYLALTTVSLYLTRKHYLMLTFGSVPGFLFNLGVMIPLGSLAIASLLALMLGKANMKYIQPALIVVFGLGWLGVAFILQPLASSLLILLAQTAMMLLAMLSLMEALRGKAGAVRFPLLVRSLVILFIVANFMLLLPILVYNLYLGKLPLTINYLMYWFPLEFTIFTFAGLLPFAVVAYYFHTRNPASVSGNRGGESQDHTDDG
jgi:hypothetical protein